MKNTVHQQLLQRIQHGDENALQHLYDLYFDKLYHFATSFFQNALQAEDVVQETFIKLWQNRHKINASQSLDAYLLTIVKNASIDLVRQELRMRLRNEELKQFNRKMEHQTGESILFQQELKGKIDSAVQRLPPKTRTVFSLKHKEGLSNGEIARQLNISKKTVENHINLALSRLRQSLSTSEFYSLGILLLIIS